MEYIRGDIYQGNDDYLLQDCDCDTTKAWGFSLKTLTHFPWANFHESRRAMPSSDYVALEDLPKIGSIEVKEGKPNVVCLYGRYWCGIQKNSHDSFEIRSKWFEDSLIRLGEHIKSQGHARRVTVAVPRGLGESPWGESVKLLENFAKEHEAILSVKVYNQE